MSLVPFRSGEIATIDPPLPEDSNALVPRAVCPLCLQLLPPSAEAAATASQHSSVPSPDSGAVVVASSSAASAGHDPSRRGAPVSPAAGNGGGRNSSSSNTEMHAARSGNNSANNRFRQVALYFNDVYRTAVPPHLQRQLEMRSPMLEAQRQPSAVEATNSTAESAAATSGAPLSTLFLPLPQQQQGRQPGRDGDGGLNSSPEREKEMASSTIATTNADSVILLDSPPRSAQITAAAAEQIEMDHDDEVEKSKSAAAAVHADDAVHTPSSSPKNAPHSFYREFFEEVAVLGRGSFSQVCLCRHVVCGNALETLYAVKKIPVGEDPEWLRRALAEVRIVQSLTSGGHDSHPNIMAQFFSWVEEAKTSDFGPSVRCLFLLQEFAELGTLEDFMQKHCDNFLPDEAVWIFFFQALRGLRFLHERNFLHRDLKVQNLLLTQSVKPKWGGAGGGFGGGGGGTAAFGHKGGLTGFAVDVWPRLMLADFGTACFVEAKRQYLQLQQEFGPGEGVLIPLTSDLNASLARLQQRQREEYVKENKKQQQHHHHHHQQQQQSEEKKRKDSLPEAPPAPPPAERTGATGTEDFMAVELLETEEKSDGSQHYTYDHSPQSDLYSLGVVLHYMAFEGSLPIEVTTDPFSSPSTPAEGGIGKSQPAASTAAAAAAAGDFKLKRKKCRVSACRVKRPKEMIQLIELLLLPDPADRPESCAAILDSPLAVKLQERLGLLETSSNNSGASSPKTPPSDKHHGSRKTTSSGVAASSKQHTHTHSNSNSSSLVEELDASMIKRPVNMAKDKKKTAAAAAAAGIDDDDGDDLALAFSPWGGSRVELLASETATSLLASRKPTDAAKQHEPAKTKDSGGKGSLVSPVVSSHAATSADESQWLLSSTSGHRRCSQSDTPNPSSSPGSRSNSREKRAEQPLQRTSGRGTPPPLPPVRRRGSSASAHSDDGDGGLSSAVADGAAIAATAAAAAAAAGGHKKENEKQPVKAVATAEAKPDDGRNSFNSSVLPYIAIASIMLNVALVIGMMNSSKSKGE